MRRKGSDTVFVTNAETTWLRRKLPKYRSHRSGGTCRRKSVLRLRVSSVDKCSPLRVVVAELKVAAAMAGPRATDRSNDDYQSW